MKKGLLYLLFFFLSFAAFSRHIVGGEMIYDNLGGNNYRITLKIYRDCSSPDNPVFDGTIPNQPAMITIIGTQNLEVDTVINIGAPIITTVPPSINSPCIQTPGGVCVEEGIYTYTINLPPKIGGYYVVYQSCCRNNTIINILTSPGQGATYYAQIPGPEVVLTNSSPRFKKFPPIFICNNVNFTFDHSALDPDGDQLVYSFYDPFLGLSAGCASIGSAGCPTAAAPPPYPTVTYLQNYTGNYPIPSAPAFSINPTTGLLSGRPNLLGQYVVGICVQEFRNNILISTHHRDFQFNVRPCVVSVASLIKEQVQKCEGSTVTFTNQSFGNVGTLTYHWDFGVNGTLADTSNILNPTYTFPDTGKYVVTLIANPGKLCADTSTALYTIYPPINANFTKPGPQCLKSNSFNFTNTGTYINSATYKWDFSAAATPSTSTLKNPSGIVYNQGGSFVVRLIGKQATCSDTMIDSVKIIGRPKAKINNSPGSFCVPALIGFSNGSSSEQPMQFNWTFSNGHTSQEYEPIETFSYAGIFSANLMVTTSGECADTSLASVTNITVNPAPQANFEITPTLTTIFDPEITFTNHSSFDVVSMYYFFGDGNSSNDTNFIYTYNAHGKYMTSQIVMNQFGCSDTAYRELIILPEFRFWIPNTFTPNKDGMNDIFMPKAIGVLDYHFYIYNKWGQKVFSTTNYLEGWDGTLGGKNCEQDIYVWKITFTNEVTNNGEDHFGHVLLMRADD